MGPITTTIPPHPPHAFMHILHSLLPPLSQPPLLRIIRLPLPPLRSPHASISFKSSSSLHAHPHCTKPRYQSQSDCKHSVLPTTRSSNPRLEQIQGRRCRYWGCRALNPNFRYPQSCERTFSCVGRAWICGETGGLESAC